MKNQNFDNLNKLSCSNDHGIGMVQVMMAAALLAVVAMTGMQLMSGMSKTSGIIQKRASANQLELILTNSMVKPEKCTVLLDEISNYTFTAQEETKAWNGPLMIGNTEVNKGGKFGDITIEDYKLEKLKLDPDVSGIGWGSLVVSTSFMADAKTQLTKEVRVDEIKFTLNSNNKMTECSSTALDIADVCEAFDGVVENNFCKNINLQGTTKNTDAIIEGGDIKNVRFAGQDNTTGSDWLLTMSDDAKITGGKMENITHTGDDKTGASYTLTLDSGAKILNGEVFPDTLKAQIAENGSNKTFATLKTSAESGMGTLDGLKLVDSAGAVKNVKFQCKTLPSSSYLFEKSNGATLEGTSKNDPHDATATCPGSHPKLVGGWCQPANCATAKIKNSVYSTGQNEIKCVAYSDAVDTSNDCEIYAIAFCSATSESEFCYLTIDI